MGFAISPLQSIDMHSYRAYQEFQFSFVGSFGHLKEV
ncbi:hypothetical protein OROHE_003651 [Orobanche hederae]